MGPQDAPGTARRFEVRRSSIAGRGVFAREPLPGRRKIGEVGGCIVRLPEARRKVETRPRIFLIELSRRRALDCSAGGSLRFLNHRCDPNCYLRIKSLRVEVYTLRQIEPGEELTIDYGVTPHRGGMVCRCGAVNCRGRL